MNSSKSEYLKVWIINCFLFAGLLSFSGCTKSQKGSVILIAAERLSYRSFSCNNEKNLERSGLQILCQEAVRFSNLYTTSTLSSAAMGSLLTGTYPYQHKLHRSFDRIDPNKKMLQEILQENDFKTSFFSSKATILKKTGLNRGFDYFDDHSFLAESSNQTVALKKQAGLFLNWVNEFSGPYFSVIYNSDLESEKSAEADISKLEEFDEDLGTFFNSLKSQGLWENNYIILVGLQGSSEYGRLNESRFSNLHSENTNISFFIKPPRQKGDEGINWQVDSNLSIADIGFSLIKKFDLLGNFQTAEDSSWPIWNISKLWLANNQNKEPISSRKVLIESTDTWLQQLHIRFAVLENEVLEIESNNKLQKFSRLTDVFERLPLNDVEAEEQNVTLKKSLDEIRTAIAGTRWINYNQQEKNSENVAGFPN